MDLVVVLFLIFIVLLFFRRFSSFVYFIGIIDIFFRIVAFIRINLLKGSLYLFFARIPGSVPNLIGNYSSGILYTVLLWGYVIIMIIFECYVIRTFFRRK